MTYKAIADRTVLIVEANQLLKLFMVTLVESAGFVAIDADDAIEAISILQDRTDIAILVTNVVMRGATNGVELAHTVNDRWPSIKIIVVSGQAGLSEHDLPPTTLLIDKPYNDEALIFEIRSLIGLSIGGESWRPRMPTSIQ